MEDENLNMLSNLISEIDKQRRDIIYKQILRKRLIKTVSIILVLALLLFMPIEAAYLQEPEYVLLDSEHSIDRNGNCVVHAIVRHANFDRQIRNAASGITARHQVKFNDLRKYRAVVYMYRNIFDYVSEKPFHVVNIYSDSNYVHKSAPE